MKDVNSTGKRKGSTLVSSNGFSLTRCSWPTPSSAVKPIFLPCTTLIDMLRREFVNSPSGIGCLDVFDLGEDPLCTVY
jgi:hypothetical protein